MLKNLKLTAVILVITLLGTRAFAEDAAARAAKAGELTTLKGHRVLRLFGDSRKERGFAQGYLLAADIRDDLDAALTSLPNFGAAKYEAKLMPFAKGKFHWDADVKEELEGIYDGMLAKLGEAGMVSPILNRALKKDDMLALNAIADYFGPACSGFTAWRGRTEKGEVLHGRTLDFPLGPKAVADQILIAAAALPAKNGKPAAQAWIAVGWPGLVAQFSGMNATGLVACIHDGYNTRKGGKEEDFFQRGVLLREMLEEIDPFASDAGAQGEKLASKRRSACGNLFHLSWSATAAKKTNTTPSAVIEVETSQIGARVRRMDDSGQLVLTNHFCVLSQPVDCVRFTSISGGLTLLENASKKIGLTEARKLLISAEQPVAAHSVYFMPDRMEMHVSLTRGQVMSPRVAPTAFTFSELMGK